MRRDNRKQNKKKTNDNILTYCMLAATILVVAIIWVMNYLGKKEESNKYANLGNNKLNTITNTSGNIASTSTEIGKSVNEVINSNATTNNVSTNSTTTNQTTSVTNKTATNKFAKNANTTNEVSTPKTTTETKSVEKNNELSFIKPIEGEISKDFAKDHLIYSDTLKEWTSHLGIDIKANENSDVVSVESGTIKSIKNDPRYGVTITIEHNDGFQSIYSNLQTSEMVVEGEQVDKGQVIATIGNTASFESKDESHLHFELLKDLTQVNPNEYIK